MKVYPILPYNLIQGIRLAHALMESNHIICIPINDSYKFDIIEKQFGATYCKGIEEAVPIRGIVVDHRTPNTKIGSISRPLVFPHSILRYCKMNWEIRRNLRVSFTGLITNSRRKVLRTYCNNNFASDGLLTLFYISNAQKYLDPVRIRLGLKPNSYSALIGELQIWSSGRGRSFPVKSWDHEYYKTMLNSQFVLCPRGNYVWTYRFFEAMFCGAIPIVEEQSPAYDGYIYYDMTQSISGMKWTQEIVNYNYSQCVKNLTIPKQVINEQLSKLVKE